MSSGFTRAELPREVRLPTAPIPPIPPPHALADATWADGEVRELGARRARVLLSGTRGILRVEGDGVALAEGLGVRNAAGANLLAGPRAARRECFTREGGLMESLQLPEALPGILVQWTVPGAGEPLSRSVRIGGSLLPGAGPAEILVHRAPGLLWVGRGTAGVLVCAPGAGSLPDLALVDGEVRLAWDLVCGTPGAPLTLLLQAAPPDGSWPALTALAGSAAHHRRGEASAWGDGEPGVELDTGVEEMDMGVRWLRSWTRDRLLTVPGAVPRIHQPAAAPGAVAAPPPLGDVPFDPELITWLDPACGAQWVALAAAAAGDREAGRGALGALTWDQPRQALLSALALAAWTAWTGEPGPLTAHASRLAELLAPGVPRDGVAAGTVAEIRRAVAAAAEAAEIPALAGLKGAESHVRGRESGGLRLPMAGGPDLRPTPLLLTTGREGVGVASRLHEALRLRAGVGAVARGPHLLRHGWGPALLWELMTGVLGAVPDATFGRLTLSPLLPASWTRFAARGIRTGEGALAMEYERSGGHVSWTLRPTEGSVPLMVIFEPWQPLSRLRAVRVDGVPADLETLEESDWTRVKLQIPADSVRVVELEGEALTPP